MGIRGSVTLGSGVHSEVEHVFDAFLDALRKKDAELYEKLKHLQPSAFWVEWKKVHPEDFPWGGNSPANPSSIVPKGK